MVKRKFHSDAEIAYALIKAAKELGRMPSAKELRANGLNWLAVITGRRGGFRDWAKRLGLELKQSETRLGQDWELKEKVFFESHGLRVEKMTTKHPYDLKVAGKRVDVKVANLYACKAWEGYAFAGIKNGLLCDFFDLLVLRDGKIKKRFIVPAEKMRRQTLTLTVGAIENKGHWIQEFLQAVDLLR